MKKHWWIALVLVFALAIPVAASQAVKVYVNGSELKTDVAAQVINGRTMVPIRAIAEYFGKTVNYDETTKTVNITGKSQIDVVKAISKEWTEVHGSTGDTFGHAATSKGCQPCHSGQGFQRSLSDKPYDPSFVPEGAAHGEYPATIDCATCHEGVGGDIIKTGIAPKKLSLFTVGDLNDKGSALCVACHNGRRDTKELYLQAASGSINAGGYPHHATGALYTGQGGMQYPGVKYPSSTVHQTLGCVGCHMPKTDGYTSHKFEMQETNIAICQKCHVGQTEFTMGGALKAELTQKIEEAEKLAVAKVPGAVAVGNSRTNFPFKNAEGKRIDVKTVPIDAYVAAYNVYMLKEDLAIFSSGAHNPKYAKALLDESIKRLK